MSTTRVQSATERREVEAAGGGCGQGSRLIDSFSRAASPTRANDGYATVREEGWSTYGVTAELAARIQYACFDDLDAPIERVGDGRGSPPLREEP
jgi:hypothetical protein